MFFFGLLAFMIVGDIVFFTWGDRRLARLPRARLWRTLLALFMGFQLAAFVSILVARFVGSPAFVPAMILGAAFIWHLLILPMVVLTLLTSGIVWTMSRLGRALRPETATIHREQTDAPSRRQFLTAAAVAAPPLLTGIALGRAMFQLDDLRVRRLEIPITGLPPDLDGLTIAQVSDVHVGRFTRARELPAIANLINGLRADLVLMTGDLIDYTLADLPAGLDFVKRLDPRVGLFTIEGNHDLFESRGGFEQGVAAAGVPLLLNDSRIVRVRGCDVQILGIRWGGAFSRRGSNFADHTRTTLALRQPEAFPILLAHHPHAFDIAADAGIPLTLAGHTHGGQLMLSETLGAGPVMFKYWSGLYRQRDSALVVSNGVGNWFPLRINAPAEVVHITLRKA